VVPPADAPQEEAPADVPQEEAAEEAPADVPQEEVEEAPGLRLAVGIDPVGSLLPHSDGIVVLDVRDIGGGTGNAVPAAAGEDGARFIDVRVALDAEVGVQAAASVSSGGVTAESAGSALMTCVEPERRGRWPWPRRGRPCAPQAPDPRPSVPGTAPRVEPSPAPDAPESPGPEPPDSEATAEEDVIPGQEESAGAPDGTADAPDVNAPTETVRDPSAEAVSGHGGSGPAAGAHSGSDSGSRFHGAPEPGGVPEAPGAPETR
jgi:hypothetical protein